MNRCNPCSPPTDWLMQKPFAMATDDDREKAKWLLKNVIHYPHGRSNEGEDIETIAQGLAMERELTGDKASFSTIAMARP